MAIAPLSSGLAFTAQYGRKPFVESTAAQPAVPAQPAVFEVGKQIRAANRTDGPIVIPGTGWMSVPIPGILSITTDRLDKLSTANLWNNIRDITSEQGLDGSFASPDELVTLLSEDYSQTVVSLAEYRDQLEARMKENGWWDDVSGKPTVTPEEMKVTVVNLEDGSVFTRNQTMRNLIHNARTFVPIGETYVAPTPEQMKADFLAYKQRIASRVEADPAMIAYEKMLKLFEESSQQRTAMDGNIERVIASGNAEMAARVFNYQMERGEFRNVDFVGTWGDRSTTSVEEYGTWLNQLAASATA